MNFDATLISADLRDYQVEGIKWLLSKYSETKGAILADEMGLGKTIQSIGFLVNILASPSGRGPFLVLAPLSCINNWKQEFTKFSSSTRVLVYHGSKEEREATREKVVQSILAQPKTQRKDPQLEFDVLITSYEMAINDVEFLYRFKWRHMIIDEGHRLKNPDSKLYIKLQTEYKYKSCTLLTGTPIQNDLTELWSLLAFIRPEDMLPMDAFVEKYENNTEKLQSVLEKCMLRRTKTSVKLPLPEKSEVVIHTGLSEMQKKYYKWVLEKNVEALSGYGSKKSVSNVVMQLRKVCNHPYLFDGAEPEPFVNGPHIIENSGKLAILDKLLTRLKNDGHRVLIFSQMTSFLDILQDYLALRHYSYERLDGSVRGEERFLAVNQFNSAQSDTFAFLLSTRAGGLGLNLVSADTVIFTDIDWNPQMDLQAQDRCHRLGQTKAVKIIRLITRNSVEEVILRRAGRKLKLANDVIGMKGSKGQDEETAADMVKAVTFGLHKILSTEDSTSNDEDIEKLLERDGKQGTVPDDAQDLDTSVQPEDDEADNIYFYEGKNYSEKKSQQEKDAEHLQKILLSAQKEQEDGPSGRRSGAPLSNSVPLRPRKPVTPLTEEEKEERKRKREENLAKQEEAKRQKLEEREQKRKDRIRRKWADNNYTSRSLDDEVESSDEEEMENDGSKIEYVKGDVTHPQENSKVPIIIFCCDNSGSWGRGGMFWALSKRSKATEEAYELAGAMEDLDVGSAHLVDSGFGALVAFLVVQKRTKNGNISGIDERALEEGLLRVMSRARRIGATVHMPRIGADLQSTNWYAIERIIRRCRNRVRVRTVVYYFSRSMKAKTQQSNVSTVSQTAVAPSMMCPGTSRSHQHKDDNVDGGLGVSTMDLNGIFVYLHGSSIDSGVIDDFKRLGGSLTSDVRTASHIVTGCNQWDEFIAGAVKASSGILIVSDSWLRDLLAGKASLVLKLRSPYLIGRKKIFEGVKFNLHKVNEDDVSLSNLIIDYGGMVVRSPPEVGYVLTDISQWDDYIQQSQRDPFNKPKILRPIWARRCVEKCMLVPIDDYKVPMLAWSLPGIGESNNR